MLASPDYDGESRRGAVQSRSMFLEGTYEFSDDLKLIAGARYNDDRDSAVTTPIAVGGLLLANTSGFLGNGFLPVGSQTCANPGGLQTPGANCVGTPLNFRLPTDVTGQQNNTMDKWTGRLDPELVAEDVLSPTRRSLCPPCREGRTWPAA